jgi:hypothetical protein
MCTRLTLSAYMGGNMKLGGWNRETRVRLAPWLRTREFAEQESLCFVRKRSDHTDILRFGGRIAGNQFKISCFVGIRFDAVSRLLEPDEVDGLSATIANPIHLLAPERKFYERTAVEAGELEFPMAEVVGDVERYAFPCFERFGDMENVAIELRSASSHSTFLVNKWQRVTILAALLLARGDQGGAKQVLFSPISLTGELSQRDLARIAEFRDRVLHD